MAEFQRSLLKLDVLPRLVFVLRSLEGYSPREIALLLEVDLRILALAYERARKDVRLEGQFPDCADVSEELRLNRNNS